MEEAPPPDVPTVASKLKSSELLRLTIENRHFVEVDDLAAALKGIGDEYRAWVEETSETPLSDQTHLYVRSLTSGSIIADFVRQIPAYATLAMPFMENANTLLDFAKYLFVGFDVLRGKINEPQELPPHSLGNLSAIVEPVAKDYGSQMNISLVNNGVVNIGYPIDSPAANTIQNTARRAAKPEKVQTTEFREAVVMSLFQARNQANSSTGNLAIIKSVAPNRVKVKFANDVLRAWIMYTDNPFTRYFMVDVQVAKTDGKPVLYNVTFLYDKPPTEFEDGTGEGD